MRVPSRSASLGLTRQPSTAGTSPNSTPVSSETSSVKPSTVRSMLRPPAAIEAGTRRTNPEKLHHASRTPSAPPAAASNTLSVRSCTIMSRREAPSAARSAISFFRSAARASSRLATFTHAISSTTQTAPSSIAMVRRESPERRSRRLSTLAPMFVLDSGYVFSSRAAMVLICDCACSSV
ncbi:MAG TPA: hypothetical protein PLK67_07245, partial [Bryobacteraceae bacterium]|nr:hypothetical protein [Bryobacteraceae bacterium]